MLKHILVFIAIIGAEVYSATADAAATTTANPLDFTDFYKQLKEVLCTQQLTDEQIAAIATNCRQYMNNTTSPDLIKCTGKTSLTDRERITSLCDEKVYNCVTDLISKMTTPSGYTTPANLIADLKNVQKNVIGCLKKSIGKS